ncbi:hypothetical protein LDENG_00224580, partial [Lucifuga dentata]
MPSGTLAFPPHRSAHLHPPLHAQRDSSHHENHHRHPKLMPAALLASRFRQDSGSQPSLDLLARPEQEVRPEHAAVSARHLLTM